MHLCVCMSYMLVDLNKSHKKKKHFKTDRQPKVIYLRVIIIEIIFRLRSQLYPFNQKKKEYPHLQLLDIPLIKSYLEILMTQFFFITICNT